MVLDAMLRDGLWLTARASPDRALAAWFLLAGGAFLLSGAMALGGGQSLSRLFGWALLLFSLVGFAMFGPSGFALVVPQAIYII